LRFHASFQSHRLVAAVGESAEDASTENETTGKNGAAPPPSIIGEIAAGDDGGEDRADEKDEEPTTLFPEGHRREAARRSRAQWTPEHVAKDTALTHAAYLQRKSAMTDADRDAR